MAVRIQRRRGERITSTTRTTLDCLKRGDAILDPVTGKEAVYLDSLVYNTKAQYVAILGAFRNGRRFTRTVSARALLTTLTIAQP